MLIIKYQKVGFKILQITEKNVLKYSAHIFICYMYPIVLTDPSQKWQNYFNCCIKVKWISSESCSLSFALKLVLQCYPNCSQCVLTFHLARPCLLMDIHVMIKVQHISMYTTLKIDIKMFEHKKK